MKQAHSVHIKGFVRVALRNVKTGEVQMSPWKENAITAYGFQNYICGNIGSGLAGGKKLNCLQLASQTAAANSTQTAAVGEFTGTDGARKTATITFSTPGTIQGVASWDTNEANQSNLGAIAWYEDTTTGVGTAASIAVFSTSAKSTDQQLSASYQIRFS